MTVESFSAIPTLDPLRTSGNVQFLPFFGSANAATPETPGAERTFLQTLSDAFRSPIADLGTPGFVPGDDPGVAPPLVRTEGLVLGDPDFFGPNQIQGAGDIRRDRNIMLAGLGLAALFAFVIFRP